MTTAYNTNLNERLGSYQDRVFDATALSNASTTVSDATDMAKIQSEVEFELTANNEITVADGETLTVSAAWDKVVDGAYSTSKTIAAYAPSGGTVVFAVDAVIATWTPETNVDQFVKITIAVSENQQTAMVDGQLYRTA